ncbi:phenylacetaldehyde reductase-like isoform X2 [Castanea sativa]|uniref:phenylacetaldehyde reductase-like isoform X2 n=1 Tax=Castanea sativa TaxID=21020 RepID=UPI003F6549D3
MSGEEKVVCVTGASGYIASWLVKLLLQRGYTVKATVRDTKDLKKTEHLLALDGAKERLKLFKANLLDEGSFDSAVDGCQGVFHTASPVFITASDPQLWYVLSKTLAEEAAWKFAEENGIDLVAINPGLVIGPLIQPTLGFSLETVLKLVKDAGTEVFPDGMCILVDVRDVANAHIQAFEIPAASGRYCINAKVIHYFEVFKILHGLYPTFNLLEKCEDDKPLLPAYKISQDKAESLGISFVPLEVSLRDTMESFKEYGFLTI